MILVRTSFLLMLVLMLYSQDYSIGKDQYFVNTMINQTK